MDSFKDREKGFENKFVHDEELEFKSYARRNWLIGMWAAGLLGKSGADAEAYTGQLLHLDAEAGHEAAFSRLAGDLSGIVDEKTIRTRLVELLQQARQQMMTELPDDGSQRPSI